MKLFEWASQVFLTPESRGLAKWSLTWKDREKIIYVISIMYVCL